MEKYNEFITEKLEVLGDLIPEKIKAFDYLTDADDIVDGFTEDELVHLEKYMRYKEKINNVKQPFITTLKDYREDFKSETRKDTEILSDLKREKAEIEYAIKVLEENPTPESKMKYYVSGENLPKILSSDTRFNLQYKDYFLENLNDFIGLNSLNVLKLDVHLTKRGLILRVLPDFKHHVAIEFEQPVHLGKDTYMVFETKSYTPKKIMPMLRDSIEGMERGLQANVESLPEYEEGLAKLQRRLFKSNDAQIRIASYREIIENDKFTFRRSYLDYMYALDKEQRYLALGTDMETAIFNDLTKISEYLNKTYGMETSVIKNSK